VFSGHEAGHVPMDASAVVFTGVVRDDNAETLRAKELGVPVMHRSMALNTLMSWRTSVAVLGTHGKSSTASMLSFSLSCLGQDPSYGER
jgi:UDP-N-acetylmuramate--alanine ligase